jgi:hypothetical protein
MHRFGMLGGSRLMAACVSLGCLVAACGGGKDATGPGGGGTGALAGDYVLIGAGGNTVPAVVNSDICGANEIDNGGLTLSTDGKYEMRFDWQDENGPNYSADHGRYRVQGNRVQFSSDAWGDEFEGQEAGGLLELTWDFCNDNQGPDLRLTFAN